MTRLSARIVALTATLGLLLTTGCGTDGRDTVWTYKNYYLPDTAPQPASS